MQNGSIRTFERFKLHFLQSQYVDVSVWKDEVLKRMYGVFILATVLIIGVIMVFFLVFRAMLRQKKLADIKTDFANNITHELKTPLSSVSIIFKSLNTPQVKNNPHMVEEMLVSLERQFNKVRHTVDSVLDSAMAADLRIELDELDISDFLVNYVSNQTVGTHLLTTEISAQIVMIKTNVVLLEKVLDNLLQNAVKYSPPGSVIKLNSWVDGSWYAVAIIDNGPGIAKEYQKFVFGKFYRVPEQNRHTVKGLGLGLYLAKQAIGRLHGSLTLDSIFGKGSTFTIKLPVNES
jgi:signal transduction histidine kinase